MGRDMTPAEVRAFLEHGTRTGMLGVVRRDGSAMVAPVWFVVDDDGSVVFTTGADTVKGRALRRDPRACLAVDRAEPPYDFVRVEGRVEISREPDALLHWATRIGGRYMGADRAREYGRRNGVDGELLVRLVPTRTVAVAGVSD